MKCEAVIFDWAGTTVDYGCFAPVQAFMEIFRAYGIEPTMEETRKPMGMLKWDHIKTMLQMERIRKEFRRIHGRDFTDADVDAMHDRFQEMLLGILDRFSDPKEITEMADKLRWYRYKKALLQREVADYIGIDRSTYVGYEKTGRGYYPIEHMEKLVTLFGIPVTDMLDGYNRFLYDGQGRQIRERRKHLGMTQREYAALLGVPLGALKRWEQNKVRIFKSTWERYFQ